VSDKEPKPRNQDQTRDRAGHHAEPLAGPAGRRRRTESRAVTCDEPDAYSVEEFCRKHRISIQVFYKRPDLMPASFYVGTRRLISVESAARWRRKREQLAQLADT
jgi:hypothetical protein